MGWLQGKLNGHGKHASVRVSKPLARTEDMVVEELEHEVLVYDPKSKRAHCLDAVAARVWRAADGSSDVEALANRLDLSVELVEQAVAELESCELLETFGLDIVDSNGNGNGNGLTRREMTIRSAKVGTAVAAAPLVYSILAPTPAAAATPTPAVCFLYTMANCGGPNTVGCGSVTGCCCCCQGGGGLVPPSCKTCTSSNFCANGQLTCPDGTIGHCSDHQGGFQASPGGCCSIGTGPFPNDPSCGCQLNGTVLGTNPRYSCCDSVTHLACTTAATCVPCCDGLPIVITDPSHPPYGCCTTGKTCPH
jgi:hypothetical protein